jgi:hypothetical protein
MFVSNVQEIPYPEKKESDGTNQVVKYLTGKLFPEEHEAKHCSTS